MRDIQKFIIPKTLDDPARIAYWTTKQVAIFIISVYTGILTGSLLGLVVWILIGLGFGFLHSYFQSKGKGKIWAIIYWSFSSWLSGFDYFPKSYRRRYIG